STSETEVVTQLISRCHTLQIPIARELLVAVVESGLPMDQKIDILARVQINDRARPRITQTERMIELNSSCDYIVSMIDSGKMPDILVALSFLPPLPFAASISARALAECTARSEAHRHAAIVIRANSLKWNDDPQRLARDVLSVRSRYPAHLRELL